MLCFAQDASGKLPRLYICPFDTEAAVQVGGQKEQKTDLVWAVLWGKGSPSPCFERNWRAAPAQNSSWSNCTRSGCQQIANVMRILETETICCKSAGRTIPAWQVSGKLPSCVPSDHACYLPLITSCPSWKIPHNF